MASSPFFSNKLARCATPGYQVVPRLVTSGTILLDVLRAIRKSMNRHIGRTEANTGRQSPEIQQMYSLNMPVSAIRTKIRQEFERHRYVTKLKTVDVLLFNSHSEFQVRSLAYLIEERSLGGLCAGEGRLTHCAGDTQLLEAAHTRTQVLQIRRGRWESIVAEELHTGFH